MRTWLLYRLEELANKNATSVLFRRVDHEGVHDFLPEQLRHVYISKPPSLVTQSDIDAIVRSSHWVGELARSADSELGRAILKGRWPTTPVPGPS